MRRLPIKRLIVDAAYSERNRSGIAFLILDRCYVDGRDVITIASEIILWPLQLHFYVCFYALFLYRLMIVRRQNMWIEN